jgi:GDPmannose 4,6-dehydratase
VTCSLLQRKRKRLTTSHTAEDFVLASNETHSVREFIEKSFAVVGTTISWYGKDEQEVGVDQKGRVLVRYVESRLAVFDSIRDSRRGLGLTSRVDPRYYRPAEVELLHGDCTKAEQELGWKRSVDFDELVQEMVSPFFIAAMGFRSWSLPPPPRLDMTFEPS